MSAYPCRPRTLHGALLLACAAFAACGSTESEAPANYPEIRRALIVDPERLPVYAPSLPRHYFGGPYTGWDNSGGVPIHDAEATLGRVLFYDPVLSVNSAVSCASCHRQSLAFGDSAQFSLGFDGVRRTTRHSMRLVNVRYFPTPSFGWEMKVSPLEAQVLRPIVSDIEMGNTAARGGVEGLLARVRGRPYYHELFRLAYGDDSITVARIQSALAQFVRSIVSAASTWDRRYEPNFDSTTYDQNLRGRLIGETEEERVGRLLFFTGRALGAEGGCAACHVAPHFALSGGRDGGIGLDAGETREFKAPSLKSVAVSGPYMHDGRFRTLEEVIDHYDHGVQDGPRLSPLLRSVHTGKPLQMELDKYGRDALVAFLRTLTDSALLTDPRFATPFRQ
jgi:cytochrome c peroxidase